MNNTRAPGQDTLTVGELARHLRQALDVAFPGGVWVAGEVDSINRTRSGHVYFNLVERPANQSGGAHLDRQAQRGLDERSAGGAPLGQQVKSGGGDRPEGQSGGAPWDRQVQRSGDERSAGGAPLGQQVKSGGGERPASQSGGAPWDRQVQRSGDERSAGGAPLGQQVKSGGGERPASQSGGAPWDRQVQRSGDERSAGGASLSQQVKSGGGERPASQSGGAPWDRQVQRSGGERSANQTGGAPTAVVSVVLFRDDRQRVNNLIKRHGNAIRIADGVQVRIQAVVDFYAPRGQLQLRMTSIDPAHTLGAITAYRAAVVARMSQEGLLRRNATIPMTPVPLRVGLVTSLGSAAHADMLKVFEASGHAFCVTEVDTAVQGMDAPEAIAAALAEMAARVDVVLLARGGGSSTDLAAFDHEIVARAVAGCERPVLTGIGHETDRSAADEVAHTSCSTPTAAARAVVQRVDRWLERLEGNARAIAHHSRRSVGVASRGLDVTALRLSQAARVATRRADLNLVGATRRLTRAARVATRHADLNLVEATTRVTRSGSLCVRLETGRLEALEGRLKALDPASVLRRGWSLTRRADGTLVRSVETVQSGDSITTHLADGVLTSTIRISKADNDETTTETTEHDDDSD